MSEAPTGGAATRPTAWTGPGAPAARAGTHLGPVLAAVLVFVTSAVVLIVEILAGRLLAPYVGVTLETYTGIIGVVLGGIALGSWVGGKMADRIDPRKLIGPAVALGGALTLAVYPITHTLGPTFRGGGTFSILFLSTSTLLAPAAVLTTVTPLVIKLRLESLDETGRVVGRLSALATAGAILGTFTMGFVLLERFTGRSILLVLGVAGLVCGAALWRGLRPRPLTSPAPTALLAVAALAGVATMGSPCDYESQYYCVEIVVDADNPAGRTLVLDGLAHTYVDLDDPLHIEFSYKRVVADAIAASFPDGEAIRVLHVGGGALSMPRYIDLRRPGSSHRVIEIDPLLTELASAHLGFVASQSIDVRHLDARKGILDEGDAQWDMVIGDAFGGLAVPWHLTTREFTRQVRRTLDDGGLYAVNLIDRPGLLFARSKTATLAAEFDDVAVVKDLRGLADGPSGNVILLAAPSRLALDAVRVRIAARGADKEILHGADLDDFVAGAPLLTDDFAPVDQMIRAGR